MLQTNPHPLRVLCYSIFRFTVPLCHLCISTPESLRSGAHLLPSDRTIPNGQNICETSLRLPVTTYSLEMLPLLTSTWHVPDSNPSLHSCPPPMDPPLRPVWASSKPIPDSPTLSDSMRSQSARSQGFTEDGSRRTLATAADREQRLKLLMDDHAGLMHGQSKLQDEMRMIEASMARCKGESVRLQQTTASLAKALDRARDASDGESAATKSECHEEHASDLMSAEAQGGKHTRSIKSPFDIDVKRQAIAHSSTYSSAPTARMH